MELLRTTRWLRDWVLACFMLSALFLLFMPTEAQATKNASDGHTHDNCATGKNQYNDKDPIHKNLCVCIPNTVQNDISKHGGCVTSSDHTPVPTELTEDNKKALDASAQRFVDSALFTTAQSILRPLAIIGFIIVVIRVMIRTYGQGGEGGGLGQVMRGIMIPFLVTGALFQLNWVVQLLTWAAQLVAAAFGLFVSETEA